MTRCKEFYEKLERLKAEGDEEKLKQFCDKEYKTLCRIEQHTDFMKNNISPIGDMGNVASISEGATRPVIVEPWEIQEQIIPKMKEALQKGEKVTTPKVEKWISEVKQEIGIFIPQLYNVWNFIECDIHFGLEGFEGRIPAQIIQNVLYYFSGESSLIVDPMAGSGTTYDVCKSMDRRSLCYDLKPTRPEIKKHDIAEGFPEETKDCDLIVLDPPYFNMVFNIHKTVEEFYAFIEKLAKDSLETVRDSGRVALLMQDMTEKGNYCLSGESYMLFRKAGFTCITHVSCPLSTQQFLPQQVERAKSEIRMLGRNRDLYVFQK